MANPWFPGNSPEWCFTTNSRDVYMFHSDPINLFQSWFLNIRNLRKVISPTQIKVTNRKSRIQNPRLVGLYKGWIPTQLYRDYFTSHEISIPSLTNHDFMFHVTIVGKKITAHLSSTPTAKLLGMDSSRHCIHVSGRGNLEHNRKDVGGRVVGCWSVCWELGVMDLIVFLVCGFLLVNSQPRRISRPSHGRVFWNLYDAGVYRSSSI